LLDHHFFARVDNPFSGCSCESALLNISSVNVCLGSAREDLDELLIEGEKDEGKMHQWNKNNNNTGSAIDVLKNLTKFTSTQIASVGVYHLCPEMKNKLVDHWHM
jgi:hypothetical protein